MMSTFLLVVAVLLAASHLPSCRAFIPTSTISSTARAGIVATYPPTCTFSSTHTGRTTRLCAAEASLPEITSMKAKDMRAELESYGISCQSFFEKSELVEALTKARAEGKVPINGSGGANANANANANAKAKGSEAGASASDSGASREAKIQAEMENCRSMKVGDLKKELQSLGVSTRSFFEKSEFVKALAEARVDGVKKGGGGGAGQGFGGRAKEEDEPYDPSYRDVVMQKMNVDPRDPRLRGPLIDVKLGR